MKVIFAYCCIKDLLPETLIENHPCLGILVRQKTLYGNLFFGAGILEYATLVKIQNILFEFFLMSFSKW